MVGSPIEFAVAEVPSLIMDRHSMRAVPGVMARDIAERGKVRGAIDLEHDVSSLKAGFCVGCRAAARVCRFNVNGRQFPN